MSFYPIIVLFKQVIFSSAPNNGTKFQSYYSSIQTYTIILRFRLLKLFQSYYSSIQTLHTGITLVTSDGEFQSYYSSIQTITKKCSYSVV